MSSWRSTAWLRLNRGFANYTPTRRFAINSPLWCLRHRFSDHHVVNVCVEDFDEKDAKRPPKPKATPEGLRSHFGAVPEPEEMEWICTLRSKAQVARTPCCEGLQATWYLLPAAALPNPPFPGALPPNKSDAPEPDAARGEL